MLTRAVIQSKSNCRSSRCCFCETGYEPDKSFMNFLLLFLSFYSHHVHPSLLERVCWSHKLRSFYHVFIVICVELFYFACHVRELGPSNRRKLHPDYLNANQPNRLSGASLCLTSLSATYLDDPVRSSVTRILSFMSKMSATNKPLTQKHFHPRQCARHQ